MAFIAKRMDVLIFIYLYLTKINGKEEGERASGM